LEDTKFESERSEQLLRRFHGYSRKLANTLRDCRERDIICDRPHCPQCARQFRRFFTGELLKLVEETDQRVDLATVLLKRADLDRIADLNPTSWKHTLRKRLDRSGLADASVIGGFEISYRQSSRNWLLHAHLLIIGAKRDALREFRKTFGKADLDRPVVKAVLRDKPKQLSYLLKYSTYHRPLQQTGPSKGPAVPLNPAEHHALVQWMFDHPFKDYMFFYNAEQRGPRIRFRSRKVVQR
jgi:hypothetical protein